MSGDLGAEVVVRAAKASVDKHPNLRLVLVGDESQLSGLVSKIVGEERRIRIHPSSEVVCMSETAVDALRKKKDSSMRVAIDLVRDGEVQGPVRRIKAIQLWGQTGLRAG